MAYTIEEKENSLKVLSESSDLPLLTLLRFIEKNPFQMAVEKWP